MSDNNDEDEYEVGYGKPPKEHRFPPGKSGNEKGRPKGSRNFRTIFKESMQKPITVNMNGEMKTMPTAEALLVSLQGRGFSGDLKALKYLLDNCFSLDAEDRREEERKVKDLSSDPFDDDDNDAIIARVKEDMRRQILAEEGIEPYEIIIRAPTPRPEIPPNSTS